MNPLNWVIQQVVDVSFKKKQFKNLCPAIKEVLAKNGNGLYVVNIANSSGDWVLKTISRYSNGLVHTVIVAYYDNWASIFSQDEIGKINRNLKKFYDSSVSLTDIDGALVLSSANPNGIHCCAFSYYNNSKMTIRKIPATDAQKFIIASFLAKKIGTPYDMIGLFGFLFNIGDSDSEYWCSEIDYDACKKAGIIIADRDDPSPGDIEAYDFAPKIYDNRKG